MSNSFCVHLCEFNVFKIKSIVLGEILFGVISNIVKNIYIYKILSIDIRFARYFTRRKLWRRWSDEVQTAFLTLNGLLIRLLNLHVLI